MKEVWKGAAAGILALSLGATGFIGASSAFADDAQGTAGTSQTQPATTGSITITDNRANQVYNAYQLFAGSYADGKLGDITWGTGITEEGKTALIAEVTKQVNAYKEGKAEDDQIKPDYSSPKGVAEAISALGLETNSSGAKALANVFKASGLQAGKLLTAVKSGEDTTGYTATGLEFGWYIIKDETANTNTDNANSSFITKVVGAATATPKSVKPSVDKKVKDEVKDGQTGGDTAGWGDSADHAINETFQFKVSANLPASADRADYTTYKVVFHDTMSAGVTYEKFNTLKLNGNTLDKDKYTVAGPTETANTLTIEISDIKALLSSDSFVDEINIEAEYDAHLNEEAQVMNSIGDITNKNDVYLEYSNNPNAEGTGKTATKEVYVASFKMDNTKVANTTNGNALAGAEFNLKDKGTAITFLKDTDNYYYPSTAQGASATLTSDNDGHFNIKGLDAGTYVLTETKAPAGYNTMVDKTITIAATHGANKVTELNATGDLNLGENKIVNIQGSELPETGGMGTVVLYTVGGLIVLIAGVGLAVALRRR